MRIIWYANAPWINSGYGIVCRNVVTRLQKKHDIAIQCNYGLYGNEIVWNGIKCFPAKQPSSDLFSASTKACFSALEKNMKSWKGDVAILHYDTWVNSDQLITTGIPYVPYAPIDGYPVSPLIIDGFKTANKIVVYCDWAKKILKEDYDIDAFAIPHGIDPTVFYPVANDDNKKICRRKFGLSETQMIFTCIGSNNGTRKGFAETMEAYGNFLHKHPEAVKDTRLYMHTDYVGFGGGYNLYNLCQLFGIAANVKFTTPSSYENITSDDVADLYRASDVLLNCSHGEGFGIPIIEASACGIPVVATDFTSMTELVKGHGMLVRPSGRMLQNMDYTYHAIPFVPDIVKAMETYYEDWKGSRALLKEHGESGAKIAREKYNWDDIIIKWEELLKVIEEEKKKKEVEKK